jgi:hypothetical protein
MRKLPFNILRHTPPLTMEANNVYEKFSKASSEIGEQSTDYVALSYLSDEAMLYWIPRFLDYLETTAPSDTFHFDVVLSRLSDVRFIEGLSKLATPIERSRVISYLDWLSVKPEHIAVDSDVDRLERARRLWSVDRKSE